MFSVKTRLRFIKSAISNFSNVETDHWAKQLDEYVKITHAKIIIKGITTNINLQNELNSNIVNETINEDVHFVFIMPNPKNMYINSELVKNLCFLKKNLNSVVPKCIEKEVKEEVWKIMSVNNFLDELENLIAGAWRIPMTKGRCAIPTKEVQNLIDDIRLALPKEIKESKIIIETRNNILQDAKEEAKNIVANAKKRANYEISETNIVKQSRKTANEIISNARFKTKDMLKKTNSYVENLLDELEKVINATSKSFKVSSNEIRKIIKKTNFRWNFKLHIKKPC